jgi:osmotically-inducible protein OsmY
MKRRITLRLASILTLSAPLLVSNPSPAAVAPPAFDRQIDDALKALEVKTTLIEKLGSDALSIVVTVTGQTAMLTGEVSKDSSQALAEQVALSVEGIATVENKVTMQNPPQLTTATAGAVRNALVETKVKALLLKEIGASAFEIDVTAAQGVVSLRGRPDDRAAARATFAKIRGISGVKHIVDLLE